MISVPRRWTAVPITKTQIGQPGMCLLRRDLRLRRVQRRGRDKASRSCAFLEMAVFSAGQGGSQSQAGDALQPGLRIKKSVFRACNSSKSILQANSSSPTPPLPQRPFSRNEKQKVNRRLSGTPFVELVRWF